MIDIKLIRENFDFVKQKLVARNSSTNLIDQILDKDFQYRKQLLELEKYRAERNKVTENISKNPPNKADLIKEIDKVHTYINKNWFFRKFSRI